MKALGCHIVEFELYTNIIKMKTYKLYFIYTQFIFPKQYQMTGKNDQTILIVMKNTCYMIRNVA